MGFLNQLNLGGKFIFISTVLAVISLFLPWADLGFVSASGFQQDAYLFLLLFAYPVYKALKKSAMNRVLAFISSGLALIVSIIYLVNMQGDMMGVAVNTAGAGLYLFILCCLALLFGVYKYQVPQNQ